MNCPTELMCSLYADGVLPPDEAAALEGHLATCAACTARVAALAAENAVLRTAFALEDETVAVPAFQRPLGSLAAAAGALLLMWLSVAAWRAVLDFVPIDLDWLNPLRAGELWDLFIAGVLHVLHEGTGMIRSIFISIGLASVVVLGAALAFATLARRHGAALVWSALLATLVLPSLGHALEIRRDDTLVQVPAGETLDDTLIVFGDSVAIDGNVTGDLIAFARSVAVRGRVDGDVLGFAETLELEGTVGGTIYGFGRSLDVGAQVARNLFGFGSEVTVANAGNVRGNATMFGNNTAIRGEVGADVTAFAAELTVSGTVGRDVRARVGRLRVLPAARIAGDLEVTTGAENNVQIAPDATIGGATNVDIDEAVVDDEASELFDLSFYFGQVLRVAAALIFGLVLFWLFPGLRAVTLASPMAALTAGGVGLATGVLLPIVSVIACITIIGLPLGIAGLVVWLLGLYFAKIVVAFLIGRRLFESRSGALPHQAALLLVGLVIVIIAVNLPLIGGLLNFVLVVIGLGLLVLHFAGHYRQRYA